MTERATRGGPDHGMFVLAVITAVEKNAPWGRRLGRPLGVALVLGGLAVVNG